MLLKRDRSTGTTQPNSSHHFQPSLLHLINKQAHGNGKTVPETRSVLSEPTKSFNAVYSIVTID
jgi:hypothetical protein